jgi:chromosome partitioning protein
MTMEAKSITLVHHKGGTGKTTACLNIAGWLVRLGRKVLVVDIDPQGNATAGLGVDRSTLDASIYDVFLGTQQIENILLETDSGIFLAPSSVDLLAAEIRLAGKINNAMILKRNLGRIAHHFDYILIDVPPGSTLLMMNGIAASENIIIPMDSGIFAYETLETLKVLIEDLHVVLGIETNVMMVLLKEQPSSLFERSPSTEIKSMVRKFLADNLGGRIKVFTIPFSNKVNRAQLKGIPVSHFAPSSKVSRAFKKIVQEIAASS